MIRTSVLPDSRDRLWPVFAARLDAIEHGLTLVLEGLDCSGGQHGIVDGLARDGAGAPVLVLVATPGDPLLLPRVVSAAEFLARVGDALVTAVPEGHFCRGALARVLVIGTDAAATALHALVGLGLPRVEVCSLEPFRLAGTERFAITWLTATDGEARSSRQSLDDASSPDPRGGREGRAATIGTSGEAAGDAAADAAGRGGAARFENALGPVQRELWQELVSICERLDSGVRLERDGLLRRITWQGRLLGRVACLDGTLCATAADGARHTILSKGDVRAFADRLLRRYAELAGLVGGLPAAAGEEAAEGAATTADEAPTNGSRSALHSDPSCGAAPASPPDRSSPARLAVETGRDHTRPPDRSTLRTAVTEALLSPEEFAALAEPDQGASPKQPPD